MKYIVDETIEFETAAEVIDYCFSEEDIDESDFNYDLDDAFGEVNIAGLTYDTSEALQEVDPTAYRTQFEDWRTEKYEEKAEEYLSQVEEMTPGETLDIESYTVECVAEEDDEEFDSDDDEEDSD